MSGRATAAHVAGRVGGKDKLEQLNKQVLRVVSLDD